MRRREREGEGDRLIRRKMWGKLNQSVLGDNEEGGESLLDEESEGLFNLSATQVPIYIANKVSIFSVIFAVFLCF